MPNQVLKYKDALALATSIFSTLQDKFEERLEKTSDASDKYAEIEEYVEVFMNLADLEVPQELENLILNLPTSKLGKSNANQRSEAVRILDALKIACEELSQVEDHPQLDALNEFESTLEEAIDSANGIDL